MKKPDTKNRYRKIRAELAAMLGFGSDPDAISIDQAMRLDVVMGLKSALDGLRAKLYRGEQVDVAEMKQLADTLERFLPKLPEPEPVDHRSDGAHERLMRIVDNWIANHEAEKAERAAERAAQGLDALPDTLEAAHAEIERLRVGNPDALKFWAGPESDRVVTPGEADIVPPGEQTGGRNLRIGKRPGPDDPKPRSTAVIDAKAEPVELMPDGSRCPPGGRWCPTLRRVVPIPPVARSGEETKASMARVNDRSLDYKIMSEPSRVAGEPKPSLGNESWRFPSHPRHWQGDKGTEW
jgi:hypothetical protein